MTAISSPGRGPYRPWRDPAIWTGVAALCGAVAIAPLATASPDLAAAGVVAIVLAAAVAVHPPLAAYTVIALTPLIAGLNRGAAIPVLRPNEALVAVVAAGLIARLMLGGLAGRPIRVRLGRVDLAIIGLAVAGSVLPLLWMYGRGVAITQDDAFYALVIWKYYALFLVIRASVATVPEVSRCLWLSLAAACVVSVVGILQSLNLFGVPGMLESHFNPTDQAQAVENMRGSSTLAAPQAVADVMTFNLAIAAGLLLRGNRHRVVLVAIAVLLVFGALASGQFSGAIGLLVGVVAFGVIVGRLGGVLLAFCPAALGALIALRPVVERRLSGFDSAAGLPSSWVDRYQNLTTFFWPQIQSGWNWLLGVRPGARVAAPLGTGRIYIYIESGYVWLLWSGGLVMVAAFVYFVVTAVREVSRIARARSDAVGVAAMASFTAMITMVVLMVFDPHLTLRGSADLSFALLALALSAAKPLRRGSQSAG
jgi:hypothetical protein